MCLYKIAAKIPGFGCNLDNIGCFDPTVVVARLKEEFPEVVIRAQDLAWRDYDIFKQHGVAGGALRTAESDARRRGPIWSFQIPTAEGRMLRGFAERYVVSIRDEEPIPGELKTRFLAFLEALRFAPFVEVTSVRIEGSDEYPV